jgi:hypothetical protein
MSDQPAELDQLAEAALAAVRAPSILNTQPWRWQLGGHTAELWVDRDRQLPGLDPDGRLLLLSCGLALDHALTALRAAGYEGDVRRLPDPLRPDLVAEIGRGPAGEPDHERYHAIYTRRTDRRPFGDTPAAPEHVDALRAAAERHGVHLHRLTADQVPALASAAYRAGRLEHLEPGYAADLAAWTSRPSGTHDGVSARTVTEPGPRTVQPRDFGGERAPGLPLGEGSERGTVYAVLFTDGDEPHDWLAAGEALSDVWLTLTARGLSASPISEVVEMLPARESLRHLLGGIGYPAIALRVGVPVEDAGAPPTSARRSGTDVIRLPGARRSRAR